MSGPRAGRLRTVLSLGLIAVLLSALAVAGYWVATGGRWYIVRTPSMGTTAPVGTLLWVKPVPYDDLKVGDMITFTPPGLHTTYSHRIYAVNPDGTLSTKGDANSSPDSWRLTSHDVVGETAARWWGVGWLVRAIPILVIGGALLYLLLRLFTRPRLRLPGAIVGVAFLLSLSVYLLRPLVGADQIALVPTDPGVSATYVSTGLLPLRLHADGGGHVDLRNGQLGTVHTKHSGPNGKFGVGLDPLVTWWWWLVLIGACFAPAAVSTLARRHAEVPPRHRALAVT